METVYSSVKDSAEQRLSEMLDHTVEQAQNIPM